MLTSMVLEIVYCLSLSNVSADFFANVTTLGGKLQERAFTLPGL